MENYNAIAATAYASLTFINLLLLLFGCIVVPFLYQIVYYRFFHPLRGYPGPFWGTVTRLWYTFQSYNQTELEVYDKLFEETKGT